MSYLFEIDDTTVWNPAHQVGEVFMGFVRVLESTFKIGSGLRLGTDDTVTVDVAALEAFVSTLLEAGREHRIAALEIRSVVVPSLVMMRRARAAVDSTGIPQELLESANDAARFMPV